VTPPLFGGCACGAIRYEASGDPVIEVNCHCRDCQRETGSAYAAIVGVPRATFRVTKGDPKHYDVVAASGRVTRRRFCGDCGSPLFGEPGVRPDWVMIRVGSLDDPSGFRPREDFFTASAQPWDHMNPALAKTPKP
jgi:hypothetical protein